MSNYEVHKNTMNDYKYITFRAPWSGRYKCDVHEKGGTVLYKAMVMSSGKVHLWCDPHGDQWRTMRGRPWQLLKEIDVGGRIGREEFDKIYDVAMQYV